MCPMDQELKEVDSLSMLAVQDLSLIGVPLYWHFGCQLEGALVF